MYVEGVMSCNKAGSLCEALSSGTKQRNELRQKKKQIFSNTPF